MGAARHNPEKAMPLVLAIGKVNEEAFITTEGNEAKASVLLLGSETTRFWQFANALAQSLSPYVSSETEVFRSGQDTQILPFDYVHPGLGSVLAATLSLSALRKVLHPRRILRNSRKTNSSCLCDLSLSGRLRSAFTANSPTWW